MQQWNKNGSVTEQSKKEKNIGCWHDNHFPARQTYTRVWSTLYMVSESHQTWNIELHTEARFGLVWLTCDKYVYCNCHFPQQQRCHGEDTWDRWSAGLMAGDIRPGHTEDCFKAQPSLMPVDRHSAGTRNPLHSRARDTDRTLYFLN